MIKLNEFITDKISLKVNNKTHTYRTLCEGSGGSCHTNGHIYALDAIYSNPSPYDDNTYPTLKHGSRLDYPLKTTKVMLIELLFRTFYVGMAMGGVVIDEDSRQIQSAKAFQLVFLLKSDPENAGIVDHMQHHIQHVLSTYDDNLLDVAVFHSTSLVNELARNSEGLLFRCGW